jgi:hypothetical protein
VDGVPLVVALVQLAGTELEVELAFAFLIEDAIASGAAAADLDPVAGHHHDRAGAEILGGGGIGAGVPDAADDHVLELAAVRVERVVGAGRDFAHTERGPHTTGTKEHNGNSES